MYLYLRVLRMDVPENYSPSEQQQLLACLVAAPGVGVVKELKQHPKGGYAVAVERKEQPLESLREHAGEQIVEHLLAHGYRAVI